MDKIVQAVLLEGGPGSGPNVGEPHPHGGSARPALGSAAANRTYRVSSPTIVQPTPEEVADTDGVPRPGHCFDTAARYLVKHKDALLVHGSIVAGGKRLAHGWVSITRADGKKIVYDGVQAKFYTQESYDEKLQAKAQHTYTLTQARAENKTSGHLGPWATDLEGLQGPVAGPVKKPA